VSQSRDKKPAAALTKEGLVGLDGRYLNHAPQCTGWFDLTREGGSGSFLILWSGIWKPNTAATIPYYTGRYGKTKRGFGFVAIGAGLEDFERPARETEKILGGLITRTNEELSTAAEEAKSAIAQNLWSTAIKLSASAGLMIILVVFIAIWMASIFTGSITHLITGISRFRAGERQFRFNAPVKDEMGILADSFDDMADSLVSSVSSPLSIVSMDRRIIYMNDAGLTITGKSLNEITGKHHNEISVYPVDSPYDPIKALHEGHEAEVLFLPDSGRYLRGTASYLTDKDGTHIGYIITSTDVTEILEEQKKITEQRTLLDTIFTASPDLIWYEDTRNTLLALNPRYASIFGKKPGELVGKNREELLPPETIASQKEKNRKAFESRKPVYSEEKYRFSDGHEETLDVVVTPVFDTLSGKLAGLLGFARDVSARVRIEQELRTTQEELEKAVNDANRANEHKGEFLARMSHEIRTPMNAIIGMTNIVKKSLSGEKISKDVLVNIAQIEASSQHLLGLLNDILDISKIEAGKIELSDETVDMNKLARTVESIIRPRCKEKNIDFDVRFQMDSPTVACDALRLRQVLLNLLGNAVKFTPECGRIEFFIIQKDRRDGNVCLAFSVKDTGIGISAEALPMLFRPFEQANNQISRRYGGTGLGLVISKSIVQLFGGDIVVQSAEGEGSSFNFELWFPEAAEEKIEEVNIDDATGRLTGKRALLVDDVPINRMIAVNLLEFTGIQIDEANDGVMALQMFKDSPEYTYNIIYMDVQMPNMNGYEASRAIRELDRPDAKTVPIVALTANAFKEDIDRAIAAGMNAHLAKPMEIDKVLEVTLRLMPG
jgi:PAS domain S-box-containing protein